MIRLLLTLSLLSCNACSRPTEEPEQAKPVLGSEATGGIRAKLASYRELGAEHRNEWGFVPKCDSLLFSSLAKVSGVDVDIEAAEDDGRWYRRPEKECYDNELADERPGSTSDISKDQYMGLLWATWYEEDKDVAKSRPERMIRYGKEEDWKVGRGPLGETFITPALRQTMAEMLAALGGKRHEVMLAYPHVWPSVTGYPAHLQTLHITLRKRVIGKITKEELAALKRNYKRNPDNALFSIAYRCFTDKDWTEAAESILNEDWFPEGRLPESKDRCTNYLWEREKDDDWEPCDRRDVHDGIDLMFAAFLLLEELE